MMLTPKLSSKKVGFGTNNLEGGMLHMSPQTTRGSPELNNRLEIETELLRKKYANVRLNSLKYYTIGEVIPEENSKEATLQ